MPTTLRMDVFSMPGASLGPVNPLPALGRCLPYGLQNRYDRERKPRTFRVAVLENEVLRASFLLELGGRLWSLIHKPSGRELLYCNPVFQPGALACCNAWFSGGVEWNCCTGGHTPLTCSPMFAARVRGDDGSPVLRLYEFERGLRVPYQIDFLLPERSPWLYARVRLTNPNSQASQMYWWSNIAVQETPDLRVLAPADAALRWNYETKVMSRLPMPYSEPGRDSSYPVNAPGSTDFFWDIPAAQRPWEAALDGAGRGLVHASTSRLRGRKLFVWGMSPGGRHWQEFLSIPGFDYIEIQAGVKQTQGEKFPLEPGETCEWVEAYGLMEADPARTHGQDWDAAWRDVDGRLERALPAAALERMLSDTAPQADRAPEDVLHRGSGWGALEQARRRCAGEPPLCSQALVFGEDTLGLDQAPWLDLLRHGALPLADAPASWMIQDEWRPLLEASREPHWLTHLHLGVMQYQAGDKAAACAAWERSLAARRTAWALRNLAVVAHSEKRHGPAADLWIEAYRLLPELPPLAVECCRALLDAERPAEVMALLPTMPPEVRESGRIRVLTAQAALKIGDLELAESILRDESLVVADLFEGDLMLSDTWYSLHEQRLSRETGAPIDSALRERVTHEFPPPARLDFRMAAAGKKK